MIDMVMADIIPHLQDRFGDEFKVVEGFPMSCTQKGTVYQTRCHLAKDHYFKDSSDIHDFIYQMAMCAVRLMGGDTISVRSAEVATSDNGVHFWLRICQESSSLPDVYRRTDSGIEKVGEENK